MIDEVLLASIQVDDNEVDALLKDAFGEDVAEGDMTPLLKDDALGDLSHESILTGKVVGFAGDDIVIDVGLKSEGLINRDEFEDYNSVQIGQEVQVVLEALEGPEGLIQLSKRKADRLISWRKILETTKEGDQISGKVVRKIKGGLLVDIGVHAFLPASQVDIRRPSDIGEYIGREVRAEVLKIDEERRNIVVSRRKLVEHEREAAKKRLLENIKEGDLVTGVVKNIADFGAFVDLGGLDGLLHITDMSWSRVNHPSEIVDIGERVEVKILNIDFEKEKIALGLKQKEASPWEEIEQKFPVNSRVRGAVTNIMSYGAFVRLDDGIEGLVHISEMSWTRRINHPSEVLTVGEEVDVVVLEIDKDKQEISLGIKQTEVNPWELVAEKYPPGTVIEGSVRNLTNYGAFVEIEPGIDGLLHVSDLSWTKKVAHPNELLEKSEVVRCVVLEVDQSKQRVALGMKQLTEDPWDRAIPEAYQPGMVVRGTITKITNFGVFVELEDDLEGLLHISELADHKVESPQDVVKQGEEVDVKILRVDVSDRKIGLSLKRAQWGAVEEQRAEREEQRSRDSLPQLGGMGDHGALGSDKIEF
ncbi:MAG: 30S ribosomal protein S1 [Planctomycetota bacterium]